MSIVKNWCYDYKLLIFFKIVNPYHTPLISFPFNKRDSILEEY